MANFFEPFDWQTMLKRHPAQEYDISEYHRILCPLPDYPDFLEKYATLPIMQRLKGVGLLCGTDWTRLYKNRFFYSRFDHSLGVALIIWHFTHDKAQTLAGLFHDIATPVFSHVSDFRKGDALTQMATEEPTSKILRSCTELAALLEQDALTVEQVEDYHIYPIADNEIPRLSADRLEYMFPSGMALDGSWTMQEIRRCYEDIEILQNEDGMAELGFCTREVAELYCERFCMIGHILQLNENKLALHLLGQVMNLAEKAGILSEDDFMTQSERQVIGKLEAALSARNACERGHVVGGTLAAGFGKNDDFEKLRRLYKTFRTMTEIEHTTSPLPESDYFCVNLRVKQRFINPLVKADEKIARAMRLSEISPKAKMIIEDFKSYTDTPFGCVRLVQARL